MRFAVCAASADSLRRLHIHTGAPLALEERTRLLQQAVAANPVGLSAYDSLSRAYLRARPGPRLCDGAARD
jgi:hypothetical protein